MAHTFDIRFVRTGGLAGLIEAPANSFRWKGAGRLSIDPQGISIAVKRGLLSLFPGSRRVAAADLTEVLREGDALRVEFTTGSAARAVIPFWVRDTSTAQEIVRLLPTTRTVELEHDAAGVSGAFRIDWRALGLLAFAVAAIGGALWISQTREDVPESTPVKVSNAPPPRSNVQTYEKSIDDVNAQALIQGPKVVVAPPDPLPGTSAGAGPESDSRNPAVQSESDPYASASDFAIRLPATNRQEAAIPYANMSTDRYVIYVQPIDGVVPIVPEMPIYPYAVEEIGRFRSEISNLMGSASTEEAWWQISVRIYNYHALDHPDLWALRDMELAISRAWRHYLYVRSYNPRAAEPLREMAEHLTKRLDLYVR
jgi:hypothetical protein